ncbi:MAG: bifunctional diaminohydroxyphosphoribosylaminopyrimidine deaminase/5-amino-6-(5-phosphoribosylamino)uracil reductase RibD [Mariprofundaceae bacterium]
MTLKIDSSDERYMRRAIRLAKKGVGRTHPNPRVGAVVVAGGVIVGEGYHHKAGAPHAEVNALQAAGKKAQGASIYVSLEPCAGHGRTPPCTQAILAAGIKRVVFASADPNPHMAGGSEFLSMQGIEVCGAILQAEADALNVAFFHYLKTSRPYVIAKAAISLDGKLATYQHDSKWITGEKARKHAHKIRAQSDAILVGSGTLMDDNPSLTVRDTPFKGGPPLRVVIAKQTPAFFDNCKLLDGAANSRMYVYQHNDQSALWTDAGMEVVQVKDLYAVLKHLAATGCLQLMLEGGGGLHASFLEGQWADELLLYQAPLLIGGIKSVNFWHGLGIAEMNHAVTLKSVERRKLGDDMMIRGQLVYPHV